jgi:hypothetical protein
MKEERGNNLGFEHVPEQVKGSEMNAVERLDLEDANEALHFFDIVKQRLLDVNKWENLAKLPMSSFRLCDRSGQEIQGQAKEGDYIKIDIPGPGTQSGGGFDWVIIESINADQDTSAEYLSMRVRPAANPTGDDTAIAHFLEEDATSTFQVKRMGNTIYAEEHGRNEVPNKHTEKGMDNIRNTLVGWGAKLGLSYPQWKSLVSGLISREA